MTSPKSDILWCPQAGPQKALIDCPLREIFFGGARGGGKTDGVLGKYALKAERYGAGFNGIFFRRELPMLDDAIERSAEIYGPLGARWQDQKKTWRFPNGGRLRFRPLESVEDAGKYQGQNVTDCCVEEAGNYPDPAPIFRLFGLLRSAKGVPTQLILTGNPGGPGQSWIKARYIDPAPLGMRVIATELPNKKQHKYVFIPSKITDNKLLGVNDPDYVNNLYLVGSPALVAAWLSGDWSAIEGAYFPEFGLQHILQPFQIPAYWTRFQSLDWGSARPFSVGWWAVSDGTCGIPSGALVNYREWYGASGPNKGVKMRVEEVAAGIKAREAEGENMAYRVADPSIFQQDGGPSIAETFARCGVNFRPADNKRVAGWEQIRSRLVGDEKPMIYFFSTCRDIIRTLPALQHDVGKPEDCDTEAEDHAPDQTRYAAMSRPWAKALEQRKEETIRQIVAKARSVTRASLDELIKLEQQKQRRGWR